MHIAEASKAISDIIEIFTYNNVCIAGLLSESDKPAK